MDTAHKLNGSFAYQMELPLELFGVVCESISTLDSFKAWRLTCKAFYAIMDGCPKVFDRYVNGFMQLFARFPEDVWDWTSASYSRSIPLRFIMSRLDLPWDGQGIARRKDVPWQFIYEHWPEHLVRCLANSPDYAEFFDIVLGRCTTVSAYWHLSANKHLTLDFVRTRPRGEWSLYGIVRKIGPDDIDFVIEYADRFTASWWRIITQRISPQHIRDNPQLPWAYNLQAIHGPDPEPMTADYIRRHLGSGLVVGDYEGEYPIEYVLKYPETAGDTTMFVNADAIFENLRGLQWRLGDLSYNRSVTWRHIVDHPEIPWDFGALSGKDWHCTEI